MTFAVFMSAITSALLNAGWNILAQRHAAPRDVLYGITLATAAICALALPFVGAPTLVTWPWIGMASLCNILYLRTLGKAYAHPDFCAVYAIVRSIVPAVLFMSGWLILNEPWRLGAFAGLAIVAVSIVIFAVPGDHIRKLDLKTLAYSMLAGLLLALALFLDVNGIRAGGEGIANLMRYAVASSLVTAACLTVLGLMNRANPLLVLMTHGSQCCSGALLLLCSYLFGMWAYAQGPIGMVAPVRESSILFGGVLTVLVLRQHVTRTQWAAMVLAMIGIVLVHVG